MRNLGVPDIANELISVLKRGRDISEEVKSLKKHEIEEIGQYSDTQLLILDFRLRTLHTRNDAMRGRKPIDDHEIKLVEKEIELFSTLRSKMAELL